MRPLKKLGEKSFIEEIPGVKYDEPALCSVQQCANSCNCKGWFVTTSGDYMNDANAILSSHQN